VDSREKSENDEKFDLYVSAFHLCITRAILEVDVAVSFTKLSHKTGCPDGIMSEPKRNDLKSN
jgi:hypothetical protein